MTETNTKDASPDLAGLGEFVRDGDRNEPLYFAGRKAELRKMEALLSSVKKGKVGLTRVITAAPGAGKTALLRELEVRFKKSGAAKARVSRSDVIQAPHTGY